MIPLTRWLAERSEPPSSSSTFIDSSEDPFSDNAGEEKVAALPGREEELLAALEMAEGRLAELSRAHADREQELLDRLGDALRKRLDARIDDCFRTLLSTLEESLSGALMPFLGIQAREKAVIDLLHLIRQELREAEQPIVEIRAPAHLHDSLVLLREHPAVSVAVSEAEVVEVIFAAQRMRFEELSARWCAAIEGREA